MTESTSSGTRRGSVTLAIFNAPITSVARAIGRTRMNMNRQLRTLRMSPERVGPIAGATAMTIEMFPMVRPR